MALYYGKQKSTPLIIKEVGNGTQTETTWAYHTGQAEGGDKVFLTKVNSLATPDDAFCNGFRPYVIMNGYAYGYVGETQTMAFNARRQIVNGVIDDSITETIDTSNMATNWSNVIQHFALNGTAVAEITYNTNNTPCENINGFKCMVGTTYNNSGWWSDSGRYSFCENNIISVRDGGTRGILCKYTSSGSTFLTHANYNGFAFEDMDGQHIYVIDNIASTSPTLHKIQTETMATETMAKPTIKINKDLFGSLKTQILWQTKDCKYLLMCKGYIDLDLENNTFTFNEFPSAILNEIGDRTIYCMQVFYDGYFSIQLDDGTTLMCKYTNSMEDVEIKEIIEPIIIEGDETIYHRMFSPDRMYWVNRPLYTNKVIAVPLANNPAGPYKFKEASSDYMAFRPSKDRFNSTVLTGFLTGEEKFDSFGRKLVEIKPSLRDKS